MVIKYTEIQSLTHQFFKKHLRLQGRNYEWLACHMGLSYDHTWSLLNGYKPLLEKHKQILIDLLEIPILSKDSEKSAII